MGYECQMYAYNTLEFNNKNNSSTFVQKIVAVGGSFQSVSDGLWIGFLNGMIGNSRAQKRTRVLEHEREDIIEQCYQWDITHFKMEFGLAEWQSYMSSEFENVLEDPIYTSFKYYRFWAFREFLKADYFYTKKIYQLRDIVNTATDFNIYGCSQKEFKAIVNDMADEARRDNLLRESELARRRAEAIEAQKKATIKQQQQNEYKESVLKVMQAPESKVATNSEIYQQIDCNTLSNVEARRLQILQRRKDGLSAYNHACDRWQESSYHFLDKAQKLLNEHSMKIADYVSCFGNTIQRALHQEMVTIIHDTADMRYVKDDHAHERESVATTIMHFIQTGNLYNREGQIGKTFSCLDFCWGLLDCQTYVLNTLVQTSVYISQVAVAATKGVARGGLNVVFKIGQPIRTVSDFADEVAYLIALTGEHLQYAHEERKKTFKRMRAQIDLDKYNLSIGTVTQAGLMQRDFSRFKSDCNQTIAEMEAILNHTWHNLNREKALYAVEKVSEVGTEMFLTSKVTQAVSTLLKNGSTALGSIREAGDGAKKFYNLPLNSSTLEAYIGYEATIADLRAVSAVATRKAAAKAAVVLDKASKITPIMAMSNGGSGESNSALNNYSTNHPSSYNSKPRNWTVIKAQKKLEELYTTTTSNILYLTGLSYNELGEAYTLFKDVPGFLAKTGPFQKIINHCLVEPNNTWYKVKGFAFEIESALRIEKLGDKVIEFGRKIPGSEIDIITANRVIECKNISWIRSINEYKEIFGIQLKYANEVTNKQFTVFSKHPIPEEIKSWFLKKGIEYFEG